MKMFATKIKNVAEFSDALCYAVYNWKSVAIMPLPCHTALASGQVQVLRDGGPFDKLRTGFAKQSFLETGGLLRRLGLDTCTCARCKILLAFADPFLFTLRFL